MALSQSVIDAFNKGGNGGGRRAALPDGTKVRVTIQPSTKGNGYIEREPFARDEANPNHRINALRMRFVVPEGFPNANANFFASIPVKFEMWSERNAGLVPSYQSIGLVKALGYSLDQVDEDTLEKLTDRELLNKTLELVLGIEDDPKFDGSNPDEGAKAAQNPLYAKRNTVKFINQASASAAPVAAGPGGYAPQGAVRAAAPAAANDPWARPAAAAPAAPAAPAGQALDLWAAATGASASDPWAAAAMAGAPTPY